MTGSGAEGAPAAETAPEFSVIVPALDEESELEETLRRARRALGRDVELIVVDGGSRDRTPEIAGRYARVIEAQPCRGAQLAQGADAARGRVLIFLHADTWLGEGTAEAIRGALGRGVEAGCLAFGLRPPSRDPRYRLLERGINWRTRWFATATGDQVIFATRTAYDACGGVRPIPLFEDVAFVRALRGVARFEPLALAVLTSRRRWERGGFLRTVLMHWALRGAFGAGADPHTLHACYRRWTRSGSDVSRS